MTASNSVKTAKTQRKLPQELLLMCLVKKIPFIWNPE